MGKIKKLFNTKIVLCIVAVLFFLKSAALGEVLPKKPNYLRIPIGQSRTYSRIVEMRYALHIKRLFTGTYGLIIDDRQRVTVPSNMRKQFSGKRVVLQFVNQGLIRIFDYKRWLKAMMAQAPSDATLLNEYHGRVLPVVYLAALDKVGRVHIPEALQEQTDFKAGSRVIITGVGDSIEIKPKSPLSIAPASIRTGI